MNPSARVQERELMVDATDPNGGPMCCGCTRRRNTFILELCLFFLYLVSIGFTGWIVAGGLIATNTVKTVLAVGILIALLDAALAIASCLPSIQSKRRTFTIFHLIMWVTTIGHLLLITILISVLMNGDCYDSCGPYILYGIVDFAVAPVQFIALSVISWSWYKTH